MHAVIVANGELHVNARVSTLWAQADLRIAADGGARQARERLGLVPQVVIGDLDSLDESTRTWLNGAHVEMIRYPRAKDQTDLELALDLASTRGASRITLLGVLGGRVDQLLANVLLLTRTPHLTIVDGGLEMWLSTRGDDEISGDIGDTVSLIPLSDEVQRIATEGLAYPLRHETLSRGTTRGISNEMTSTEARVRFGGGQLLIVHLFKK